MDFICYSCQFLVSAGVTSYFLSGKNLDYSGVVLHNILSESHKTCAGHISPQNENKNIYINFTRQSKAILHEN